MFEDYMFTKLYQALSYRLASRQLPNIPTTVETLLSAKINNRGGGGISVYSKAIACVTGSRVEADMG